MLFRFLPYIKMSLIYEVDCPLTFHKCFNSLVDGAHMALLANVLSWQILKMCARTSNSPLQALSTTYPAGYPSTSQTALPTLQMASEVSGVSFWARGLPLLDSSLTLLGHSSSDYPETCKNRGSHQQNLASRETEQAILKYGGSGPVQLLSGQVQLLRQECESARGGASCL